jgi:hypothetical protein
LTFDVLINLKDHFDVLKFLACRRSEIRRSDPLPLFRLVFSKQKCISRNSESASFVAQKSERSDWFELHSDGETLDGRRSERTETSSRDSTKRIFGGNPAGNLSSQKTKEERS